MLINLSLHVFAKSWIISTSPEPLSTKMMVVFVGIVRSSDSITAELLKQALITLFDSRWFELGSKAAADADAALFAALFNDGRITTG